MEKGRENYKLNPLIYSKNISKLFPIKKIILKHEKNFLFSHTNVSHFCRTNFFLKIFEKKVWIEEYPRRAWNSAARAAVRSALGEGRPCQISGYIQRPRTATETARETATAAAAVRWSGC